MIARYKTPDRLTAMNGAPLNPGWVHLLRCTDNKILVLDPDDVLLYAYMVDDQELVELAQYNKRNNKYMIPRPDDKYICIPKNRFDLLVEE